MLAIATWLAAHVTKLALLILASAQVEVKADGLVLGRATMTTLELCRNGVPRDLALFLGTVLILEGAFALVTLAFVPFALAFPGCYWQKEIHHFGVVWQILECIVQR